MVLTNPPYVTSGSSNLKEEIVKSGLTTHYKVNATGVEGLFMEWIIRSLKLGGKAFIEVRGQVSAMNAFLQEHITGMSIVQAFNREKKEYNKFSKCAHTFY